MLPCPCCPCTTLCCVLSQNCWPGLQEDITRLAGARGSPCTYYRCFAPMSVLLLKIVPIHPDFRLLFEMSRHSLSTRQFSLFHVLICTRKGEGELEPVVLSSPHQHTTIHYSAVQCSAVRGLESRDIKKVVSMISVLSGKFLQSLKMAVLRVTKF